MVCPECVRLHNSVLHDPSHPRTAADLLLDGAEGGLGLWDTVRTYVSLGPHRSGADAATVEWMIRSLPAKWRTSTERLPVNPYFDYHSCALAVDAMPHECFGVWLPNTTAVVQPLPVVPYPLRPSPSLPLLLPPRFAALVDVNSSTLSTHGAGAKIAAAIAEGAAAVVVVNRQHETHDFPIAINAPPPWGITPWRVPVALVGMAARDALRRPGARLTHLKITGVLGRSMATNMYATLRMDEDFGGGSGALREGSGGVADEYTTTGPSSSSTLAAPAPVAPPRASVQPVRLVISTPMSGWFACGGERGPGIALLLKLGRRLRCTRCLLEGPFD